MQKWMHFLRVLVIKLSYRDNDSMDMRKMCIRDRRLHTLFIWWRRNVELLNQSYVVISMNDSVTSHGFSVMYNYTVKIIS